MNFLLIFQCSCKLEEIGTHDRFINTSNFSDLFIEGKCLSGGYVLSISELCVFGTIKRVISFFSLIDNLHSIIALILINNLLYRMSPNLIKSRAWTFYLFFLNQNI